MQLTPESIQQMITCVLGERYTVQELISYSETIHRKKPLKIFANYTLPNALTGCCLPFSDTDAIYLQEGINPIHEKFVLLHELAHLLLWHVPAITPFMPSFAAFQRDPEHYLIYALNRSQSELYEQAQDDDAERLAEYLYNALIDEELSPLARELYGA